MTTPTIGIMHRLFPPNTKRRLFLSLLSRLVASPKEFARYLNPTSLKYFLYYLRRADPSLLEKLVDNALYGTQQGDDGAPVNNHLLRIAAGEAPVPSVPVRTETVDIIIPVYNAPELTAACIRSVLENSKNCNVIVVNDASPDERIRPLLDGFSSVPERRIQLRVLHNQTNLGFVKTVNLAYRHTRYHFVILNSDTEVPAQWLDRLFAPILADPNTIASATPFSNAGMGCSFPEPDKDFPLFKGLNLTQIDNVFSRFGSAAAVEIFTGVGFCMAFNRTVTEKIGLFDEETFGKGYAEEADWSVRASEAGFRNVLVTNLFVYHKHGGSFSQQEKNRLLERNLAKFWDRHRSHVARHQEMAEADAAREVREALAVTLDAMTKQQARRVAILDVAMSGGGTMYSSLAACYLRQSGYDVLHFKFDSARNCIHLHIQGDDLEKAVVLPGKGASLTALLRFFSIDFIFVNELYSWPSPAMLMEEVTAGAIPYLVVLHDFFLLCPRWFLVDNQGTFCGLPKEGTSCAKCVKGNAFSGHRDIYGDSLDDLASWRETASRFLAGAARVICFSESTRDHFLQVYPLRNLQVNEHAIPDREFFTWRQRRYDASKPLVLAMIGNLIPIKGERIVQGLLDSERFVSLPVVIKIFGKSLIYPAGYCSPDGKLRFFGGYQRHELPKLLEKENVSAVLIPSVWPETFSYTTSEAMLLGYPVICFPVGAPAERVRRYQCGIVAAEISPEALVDAIDTIVHDPRFLERLSCNCRQYEPVTAEQHFGVITEVISGSSITNGGVGTAEER